VTRIKKSNLLKRKFVEHRQDGVDNDWAVVTQLVLQSQPLRQGLAVLLLLSDAFLALLGQNGLAAFGKFSLGAYRGELFVEEQVELIIQSQHLDDFASSCHESTKSTSDID